MSFEKLHILQKQIATPKRGCGGAGRGGKDAGGHRAGSSSLQTLSCDLSRKLLGNRQATGPRPFATSADSSRKQKHPGPLHERPAFVMNVRGACFQDAGSGTFAPAAPSSLEGSENRARFSPRAGQGREGPLVTASKLRATGLLSRLGWILVTCC